MGEISNELVHNNINKSAPKRNTRSDHDKALLLNSYNLKELHWTTRQGDKIIIQKMDDNHLANVIKMLERKEIKSTTERIYLDILLIEQFNR